MTKIKRDIFVLLISTYIGVTFNRLPDWTDNRNIWVSAAKVDPFNPLALNNAAHYTHDSRTIDYFNRIVALRPPYWLPNQDRGGYRIGIEGIKNTLENANNYEESYKAEVMIHNVILRPEPLPPVGFVTK